MLEERWYVGFEGEAEMTLREGKQKLVGVIRKVSGVINGGGGCFRRGIFEDEGLWVFVDKDRV